jgi:integrase
LLCRKTGVLKRWHPLVRIGAGDELLARIALDKLLNLSVAGKGDFSAIFKQWQLKFYKERTKKAPRDPVKLQTWNTSTLAVDAQLNLIERSFAVMDVADIKPHHVNKFLEQWEGRRSAQTYRTYLERFFTWSCGQGYRDGNPATSDVVVIIKPEKHFVTITGEQFWAVREAMITAVRGKRSGDMMQCYFDLTYLLGQRGGDVRILHRRDIDEAKGLIRVKPGKTERTSGLDVDLPITEEIQSVLNRLKTISRMDSMYLFHTADGQPFTASGLRSNFNRAMKRAGMLGQFTLKDIRSMSITNGSLAGYTLKQLQVNAAHAKGETTETYIKMHITPVSEVRMTMPKKTAQK